MFGGGWESGEAEKSGVVSVMERGRKKAEGGGRGREGGGRGREEEVEVEREEASKLGFESMVCDSFSRREEDALLFPPVTRSGRSDEPGPL